MDIDYTVAALMFPAIPLMMTMYSNRFHTLSALIRQIHDQYTFEKKIPPEWENQLHVLNKRTNLLKYVMGFAAFGFLFNMSTVLMLYMNSIQIARLNFAACCICMIVSIFLFLQEIRLSNQALKFHLSDMESMKRDSGLRIMRSIMKRWRQIELSGRITNWRSAKAAAGAEEAAAKAVSTRKGGPAAKEENATKVAKKKVCILVLKTYLNIRKVLLRVKFQVNHYAIFK